MLIKIEGLWKNGIKSTPFFHSPRFVYSLRAAAPYGATALGLIYKMIDLKTIPCPMNAIPLLLVSALRADTVFV